ncbi:alpha/beta hydrolase [[Empedobacter] haloabium]|uniref:Alpha/beta hydrolase n=1 Tax=[Empedobacter] haloabium TaxID=592317 RepID=A0ABZ1UEQ9_9BURK
MKIKNMTEFGIEISGGCKLTAAMALAGALSALSGCAGKHVIPDKNYVTSSDGAIKVAFDQDGNIYPRTIDVEDWTARTHPFYEPVFGSAFQLAKPYVPAEGKYVERGLRAATYEKLERMLNTSLKDDGTLIILIHGFNNDNEEANANFSLMKSFLAPSVRQRSAVLEVFWDGLEERRDFYIASPFNFWPDALTYSNLAGTHGLRELLRRVKKNVDVRVVTHSRGVAVIMAALAQPVFGERIVGGDDPPLKNPHIKSMKIASFAPAIGPGHLVRDINEQLIHHPVDLFLGFNRGDIITGKLFLVPASFWGTTTLGSDLPYVKRVIATPRDNLKVRAFQFRHGGRHDFPSYAGGVNVPVIRCMYSLMGIGEPAPCDKNDEITATTE